VKKVIGIILGILAIAVATILLFFQSDTKNPYADYHWGRFSGTCTSTDRPDDDFGKNYPACDYSVPESDIPTFREIDFPFTNKFDNTRSLPLMACALIDVEGDGVDEVFVSGGVEQADALFRYSEHGFEELSNTFALPPKPQNTTTLGASSADLDGDGRTDLILTGDYGVLWYRNTGSGFEVHKIEAPLNEKSSAATTTLADYDRDGDLDIFLCAYLYLDKMEGQTIFKDSNYGATSLLLQNNGDQTFTDVTETAGLKYVHNTFQAVFVDLDNDGLLDLVVAHDTGEVRTYKNKDGQHFEKMPNPTTGKYAYPMGIAVGDYNNDGLVDLFFSNTGTSVPVFLARGDLETSDVFNEQWILFENQGNFTFTDVAKSAKVADFEFSWGAIFEDFNLDGRPDLVVAENYVDFPPHKLFKLPCRFLIQRPDGTFAAVEEQAGVVNKNYAISPLTSDFNLDGWPDLLYSNLDGPVKAFINNGGQNHYLAFRFPEKAEYVGSSVTVTRANGEILSDVYVIGEGLSSDQTATLTFGLGSDEMVQKAVIRYPNGGIQTIENPKIDQVHTVQIPSGKKPG